MALKRYLTLENAPLLIMLFCGGVLATAYFFEHVLGILPCALCQYQRLAWWIALGVAGIAFYTRRRPTLLASTVSLAGMVMLAGGAVAFYHVGVEVAWWEGPASCSSSALNELDIHALRDAIMTAPVIRCDEVAWSLFGISMAGYNVLLALAAAAGVFWLVRDAIANATPQEQA